MWEREGECQVDIVDGDNAAEIAGEQRGLMMTLLASERTSELSELDRELLYTIFLSLTPSQSLSIPLFTLFHSLFPSPVSLFLFLSSSLLLALHRPHHTTCVVSRIELILSTLQTLMKLQVLSMQH